MLNKTEKQKIVECTKDLYKLVARLYSRGDGVAYAEIEIINDITEKLEGLFDD